MGHINAVKARLKTLVEEAEPLAHVYRDWRLGVQKLASPATGKKLPMVTLRVGPVSIWDLTYGRLVPEAGSFTSYRFSAHCFASACTITGKERYKHAHDLADKIKTYLETRDWNDTDNDDYPISDIIELNARESEPDRGSRNTCRVIIEGTILAKREDS